MQNYYNNPKPAILIIDMLNAYFQKESPLYSEKNYLVSNINQIVDYSHSKDIPVIWVRQELKRDLSDAPLYYKKMKRIPSEIEGEDSSQILEDLNIGIDDQIIVKKRFSAFFNTNLEIVLNELEINTLVIGGVNSMSCVRATVNDAYQMDYEVILALDCIDGYDKEQHKAVMKYMQYSQSIGLKNTELINELKKIVN